MISRRTLTALACVIASAFLLGLTGCESRTHISRLLDDPGQYEGKTVWVAGTTKAGVGILNYGTFQLTDDTGTITVVTETHGAPRDGAEVAVQGQFRSAYTLGAHTAAVIIETRRKSR